MEIPRRWQNSAWVRPLRRKSLGVRSSGGRGCGPEAWCDLPDGALGPITGMIAGFHAAFQMHSTGRTRLWKVLSGIDGSKGPISQRLAVALEPPTLHNYGLSIRTVM